MCSLPRALAAYMAAAAALLAPAAALAAPPVNNSPPTLFRAGHPEENANPWTGEGSTATCNAGSWSGATSFTYEWVIDLGLGPAVVHTDGLTGAGEVNFTALPAHVNHLLQCRVFATNGDGTSGPLPGGSSVPPRVQPLVHVTLNGLTVDGDVGGGLTGANTVTASLRRDDDEGNPRIVATSLPATIDNASGTWVATLPGRAIADDRDTLVLDYSGTHTTPGDTASSGVPLDATLRMSDLIRQIRIWRDPAGNRVLLDASRCGENWTCPRVVLHAPPALGGDIEATRAPGTNTFTADLTGTATNDDALSATLHIVDPQVPNASLLRITKAAPMLHAFALGRLFDEQFEPEARLAPKCFVFYADYSLEPTPGDSVRCLDVSPATSYALVHSRGATTLATYPLTTSPDATALVAPLASSTPAPGDFVTLRLAAPSGTRELARTEVGTLRVDLVGTEGIVAASCTPGRRLMGGGTLLCPASGTLADPPFGAFDINSFERAGALGVWTAVTLEDDVGGGGTAVNVPDVGATAPLDGESVWGSTWKAYASVNDSAFPWAARGTPTEFAYRTRTDPLSTAPWTVAQGNPNTTAGATVSGVPPGRYEARWRVTDLHGDTNTHTTFFFQQQTQTGPRGLPGFQGPKGDTGAQGPRGPAGRNAKVTCTVKRVRTRIRVTCKVKLVSASARARSLKIRISRRGRVYASGSARVRRSSATVRMRARRGLRRGRRYTVTVVARTSRTAMITSTVPVRLR